jgi:hypothetical protein
MQFFWLRPLSYYSAVSKGPNHLANDFRLWLIEEAVREISGEGAPDLEAGQDEFLSSAKKAAESASPQRGGRACGPRSA